MRFFSKTYRDRYVFAILALIFVVAIVVALNSSVKISRADSNNLSGWAWSSNIGWVSLNCADENVCSSSNYGVSMDPSTGNLSGYAWSPSIGWINFAPTGMYPEAPNYSATISTSTGVASGWMRALSYNKLHDDGWDGWIKITGASTTGGILSGWAWGGLVVGWLNFQNVVLPGGPACTLGATTTCLVSNSCGTNTGVKTCVGGSASSTGWTSCSASAPTCPGSLSASLMVIPSSGVAPLHATLTATALNGSAANYSFMFWQDCSYNGGVLSATLWQCGPPTKEDDDILSSTDTAPVVYQAGSYSPLVIVENGSSTASASETVTASSNSQQQYYACSDNGMCVSSSTGVYTDSSCDNMCAGGSPQQYYACATDGSCVERSTGPYVSPDCNNACGSGGSPQEHLACIGFACTAIFGGGGNQNGCTTAGTTCVGGYPVCAPGTQQTCASEPANSCGMTTPGTETCVSDGSAWGPCTATSSPSNNACTVSGGYNCMDGSTCVWVSANPAYPDQTSCENSCFSILPGPVSISVFSATPGTAIVPPETATLSWKSSGATSCSINHGVGTVPTNSSSASPIRVSPTMGTTYTLTCVGSGGSATANVTISVGGAGLHEIPPS